MRKAEFSLKCTECRFKIPLFGMHIDFFKGYECPRCNNRIRYSPLGKVAFFILIFLGLSTAELLSDYIRKPLHIEGWLKYLVELPILTIFCTFAYWLSLVIPGLLSTTRGSNQANG